MKYIISTDGQIGFKDDRVNDILPSDTLISDGVYIQFFKMQEQGKQYTIKDIKGATFEEIFTEVIQA